jgi:hypothetical protein
LQRLRDNGLCVVEAKEPALVKFLDPIPAVASRTIVENAAIELSRKVMSKSYWTSDHTRNEIATAYVDLLIRGTPLDPMPTKQERELEIFDAAKADELRRLAREEAKAERAAAKKLKQSQGPMTMLGTLARNYLDAICTQLLTPAQVDAAILRLHQYRLTCWPRTPATQPLLPPDVIREMGLIHRALVAGDDVIISPGSHQAQAIAAAMTSVVRRKTGGAA